MGMGHAIRQIAIAASLQRTGATLTLLTDSQLVATQAAIADVNVTMLNFGSKDNLAAQLENLDPSVVMIDVHEQDFPHYRWIADRWPTQLVISRVGRDFDFYGASVVLVGEDLQYWKTERHRVCNGQILPIYAGRAFLCFRDEFNLDPIPSIDDRDSTILIAHGGSDPHSLTQRCLRALERTKHHYKIKVLVGPAFNDGQIIQDLAAHSKHDCVVLIGENKIVQHMGSAAIALINGGNVRYELCITGTPFIALSVQEQQYLYTEQLSKLGIGINLGVIDEITNDQIAKSIDKLMQHTLNRIDMSKKMQVLFDTQGNKRIIKAALGAARRDSNKLTDA